ncbi:hypothetical protein NQZ79_g8054 [Umbelopsis isabellina]|nr:hypothetical protein NQZ79_g8054 [Umbelopsis isabellina]
MGATDSKLAFRKGVFRLFEETNLPANADDYWCQFWTLPESADDVFSLIGAADIRRVRDSARHNLETLIDKLLSKMDLLIHSQEFSTNGRSKVHLLNCIRVLTRIMPYVFENPDHGEWENAFFWTNQEVPIPPENTTNLEGQISTAFGEQSSSVVLEALFLADFTIPSEIAVGSTNVNYVIWETGVGSSTPIGSSKEIDLNRFETLRLLIVLLSKSMYIAPSVVLSEQDNWIHFVVARTERKIVLALLCSMLNTAAKYNPLGWGLPYNHVVFSDPRELLVVMCLRAVLVLLDYHSPGQAPYGIAAVEVRDISTGMARLSVEGEQTPNDKFTITTQPESPVTDQSSDMNLRSNQVMDNAFRHYLSKLHRPQDFQFLIDGMYRILSNPMLANNTYLPGSTKQVRCHVETMMLCWKLLEINQLSRHYTKPHVCHKAQIGLVRMSAFVLQTLSSDRAFGVKLNRSFDGHSSLPNTVRLPMFHGSYADFLIISIYNLIATTRGALSTLYPALILIITNVSPYLKNLSVGSSAKLVSLFNSFSAPGFLLADDSNHKLVEYILEAFNNIIQFQFTDNPNLIYAIIRAHSKFEKLRDFTLSTAIEEIARVQAAKEERQRQNQQPPLSQPGNVANESKVEVEDNSKKPEQEDADVVLDQQLSDKAKGKLKEQTTPANGDAAAEVSVEDKVVLETSVKANATEVLQRQSSTSSILSQTLAPPNKSRFTPTQDWIDSWKPSLALGPLLTMLDHLVPQVKELCSTQSLTSDAQVLEFLRKVTLVGILPHPQPIQIRRFQWGEALVIWFRSMLWGQAYVFSLTGTGVWNGTNIKLFQIKHEAPPIKPEAAGRRSESFVQPEPQPQTALHRSPDSEHD